MQKLIEQLAVQQGVTPEQAVGIVNTIKEFIEENFPAFANSFDGIFADNTDPGKNSSLWTEVEKVNMYNSYPLYTLYKRSVR